MSRTDKFLVILGAVMVVFCSVMGGISFWNHKIIPGVIQMVCVAINAATGTHVLCRVHYMKREAALIERIKNMIKGG